MNECGRGDRREQEVSKRMNAALIVAAVLAMWGTSNLLGIYNGKTLIGVIMLAAAGLILAGCLAVRFWRTRTLGDSHGGSAGLGPPSASTGVSSAGLPRTSEQSVRSSVTSSAPATGTSAGMDVQIARLQKLAELRERGVLTDAEFAREKARALSES